MNRKDFLKAGLVMIGGVWVPKQQAATIIVRGPRVASSPAGPDLTFFWGMEGSTYSDAEVADGSATGTITSNSGELAEDTTDYKVGASSFQFGKNDYVSFGGASNVDIAQGSVGFWMRTDSFAAFKPYINVFSIYGDATDNHLVIYSQTASPYSRLTWKYWSGGSGFDRDITSGTGMSQNTWYFVIMRWKKSTNTYSIACYDTSGSLMFSDSSSASSGTWGGGTPTIRVGDWFNSDTFRINIDSVMISADDQADLLSVRDNTYP